MTQFLVHSLGHPVVCAVDDAAIAEALAPLLPDAARVANGTESPDVRVRTIAQGFEVTGRTSGTRVTADRDDAAALAEWLVAQERMAAVRDRVMLHAAACVSRAAAVLAVGPSGSGKSAVALAWTLAGLPVLSDDALVLEGMLVHGVPRTLKLATTTAAELGVALDRTIGWTAEAGEVWFDPATAGGWAGPAPVRRVGFVRWVSGASTTITPLSRAAGLQRMLQCLLAPGLSGASAFDRMVEATASAEWLDVTFGDAADAARQLAR